MATDNKVRNKKLQYAQVKLINMNMSLVKYYYLLIKVN